MVLFGDFVFSYFFSFSLFYICIFYGFLILLAILMDCILSQVYPKLLGWYQDYLVGADMAVVALGKGDISKINLLL